MKTKRFFLLALCLVLVFATLTSCTSQEASQEPQANVPAANSTPAASGGQSGSASAGDPAPSGNQPTSNPATDPAPSGNQPTSNPATDPAPSGNQPASTPAADPAPSTSGSAESTKPKVDMKGYLSSLLQVRNQDPYSFIPTTMRSTNSANYVSAGAVQYDFSKDTAVSSIRYGGFGQQWQMVMDNIAQSELFYAALKIADSAITASAIKLNNRFDEDPTETQAEATESSYTANVSYASDVLSYTIKLKQGKSVSGLGTVQPQIDMIYNIKTGERAVRIHISDTNAMRYVVTDTEYTFAIQYGASSANRTAYCNLKKKGSGSEGHIYEYITVKGKDAVKSCADFYIDGTYTSVVGNKANGIIGMDGYINELYKTSEGKLLGYKVQETKTVFGITGTYHTLWFNLSDIKGISSVRVTEHTDDNKNDLNANNVYVNGSSALFTPTYNKKLVVKTSRKYDIELRTQYFYGKDGSDFTCYETKIPMMFIQDDHDDYTNYSDFPSDIKSENKISASVSLSNQILSKIRSDYDTLIPVFKENKARFSSNEIVSFIGTPAK